MRVFISYRHVDGPYAGRLRDRLATELGEQNVFFDVESIRPGQDFRAVIRDTIESVDAVVAVIGPGFDLDRLADDEDFVRMELAEALARRKHLIPVLVGDTPLPEAQRLPPDLRPLCQLQAARLRDSDFRSDVARLIDGLRAGVTTSSPPDDDGPVPPSRAAVMVGTQVVVILVAGVVVVAAVTAVIGHWQSRRDNSPERRYDEATHAAPVLDDPLADNSAGYHWSEISGEFGDCGFERGAYHATPRANMHVCCPTDVHLDDLAVETEMTIEAGDEGGIAFRWNDSSGYFFQAASSRYVFFAYDAPADRFETLSSGGLALRAGSNRLAVLARGPRIDLYINDEHVAAVEDRTFTTGAVALCARDYSQGTDVAFTEVKAWSLAPR